MFRSRAPRRTNSRGARLVYNSELKQNIFKQVIANERYAVGHEVTIIPTSAISVPYATHYGSRQYATLHGRPVMGHAGPVDDELLGRRISRTTTA